MQKGHAAEGFDDRHQDDKHLAATVAVLAFLFVALGLSAATIGLLFAHGAYAAWQLVERIVG
jgi:hypothetical protein